MSDELFDFLLLKDSLVEPIEKESELVRLVSQLKENFTQNRDLISLYTEKPKLISAYVMIYMATNLPKFNFIYRQLSKSLRDELAHYDFIDLGTGPGTYILAHYLENPDFKGKYYGVDHSELMLTQAKSTLSKFKIPKEQLTLTDKVPTNIKNNKILFFGNSANEMTSQQFQLIVKKVLPEVIFFIEPGTKSSYLNIMEHREFLNENEYECLFPCPKSTTVCPIVKEDKIENQNWCHQVFKYVHGADIQRLCQITQLDRNVMPLISHIYKRKDHNIELKETLKSSNEYEGFVVRKFPESKHSLHWNICLDNEDYKGLYNIELNKKNLGKDKKKELKKSSTGMRIYFSVLKKLENDTLRIKLVEK